MHMIRSHIGACRRQLIIPALLILCTQVLSAQFEKKMSVNLSVGYFNTIGWTSYEPEWASGPEDAEPTLMPNFEGGPTIQLGIQFNFNRHFSLEIVGGFSLATGWYYDYSDDGQDAFNYLYWEFYEDTLDYIVEASGEHYMDLTNWHIAVVPRYYFRVDKPWKPFVMAGISFNYTDVYFEDTSYEVYKSLGKLDQHEPPDDLANWFEDHFGIGILVGGGMEFTLNESLGITAQAAYRYIPLRAEAFIYEEYYSDYHDFNLSLGIRFSFLKSKEL